MAYSVRHASGGEELVRLAHVNKVYGRGERATEALQDINLTIKSGEFVCLLGPSGCGKSTILRIVAGLISASGGDVLYRGKPLEGVNPHTTIVFQAFALFPWLTVQENVEVALKPLGIVPLERTKRALSLLDRVGLDGFETAYPRELSGGMRQKVGFARAMAVEPELLCLDEPFSALDVLSAESLRGELMELWTSGAIPTKAILMVSHNIEEAVFMADRLIVMEKGPGHIIADIPVNLQHPRHRKERPFLQLVDQVYGLIAGKTQTEAEELGSMPGEPGGHTRPLPHAPISAISGLVERANEEGVNRIDLPRLADDLHEVLDDLLPSVQAAEMLGFALVESGDLSLTPLGQTFADASIQARKEIFAVRIKRVPIIRWILKLLSNQEDKRLNRAVFQTALELEFPPDEAERQIETAVNWGRYAEVFYFDDDEDVLFIELPESALANAPAAEKAGPDKKDREE
ncbi:MAG TPA: nitrate/sulfonate/bicarbonate ABC transporter ATP-binding protein [Aggregatilineales bacterium]|nr:nitrate/sulfonate/bicarbonate ABC transporter ATP-binding protein [Aggregatilineales bacterium]